MWSYTSILVIFLAYRNGVEGRTICSFLPGDGVGGTERHIGSTTTREKCVELVVAKYPSANGVTWGGGKRCYAEFGATGRSDNPPYQTCLIGVCHFVVGDGVGGHERYVGNIATREKCAKFVAATHPTANGATYSSSGTKCYAEFGATGIFGNGNWQTCLFPAGSPRPTPNPTDKPTNRPTDHPTSRPTPNPTNKPTTYPSQYPSNRPTRKPTTRPTLIPTVKPTNIPTNYPTNLPTPDPTNDPTNRPSWNPTKRPTAGPTSIPTDEPTNLPSRYPTALPTLVPSNEPTTKPTHTPTFFPTSKPTFSPSNLPTAPPSQQPSGPRKVKLDFGEPGVNVQNGFIKLGLPDGGSGTYSSTFEYLGQTSTIKITGYTHTRGNYGKIVNLFAGFSNLLRSSFLRNYPGAIKVEISGLKPSTIFEFITYHHSTSVHGGASFSLQYEGNRKNQLKQSAHGHNPHPPLMHTEVVQSSTDGIVRLVMNSAEGIGGITINAHMDLNGMEINHIGPSTVKLDFGEPGLNVQDGFLKLGLPDGYDGTYSSTFDYIGQTATLRITGFTLTRGNYGEVLNSYAGLSNLLRSSFLRNFPGAINVEISGLKPSAIYQFKTYHHSTSFPRGGASFSLQYEGNRKNLLKQSAHGQNPHPPLMHTEIVQSSTAGIVRLEMNSKEGIGGVANNAHMDLNGMEINFLGMAADLFCRNI